MMITSFFKVLYCKSAKMLNSRARQYSELYNFLEYTSSTKVNYCYLESCNISYTFNKKTVHKPFFLTITSTSVVLEQVDDVKLL